MPWKAAHPSTTAVVFLPEDAKPEDQAKFTIGFWPPLIAEQVKALRVEFTKPGDLHPVRDAEAFAEQSGISLQWYRTMVRYGLREWHNVEIDGKITPLATTEEEIDGRPHIAVSEDHVNVLHSGNMVVALGMRCWLYNVLTEESKKKYASLFVSASSTSRTTAKTARQNGRAKDSRTGSRGKTAKKSKAARTKR